MDHREVLPSSDLVIERVTNLADVMQCLPFEREIRKKGRDRSREADMLMFIKSQLENPFFGIWMAYNEKREMVGYTMATLILIPGFERQAVLRMVAHDKEVQKMLWEILYQWGKAFRVKIQSISAHRNIKAITRKYHFLPVSVVMERRI